MQCNVSDLDASEFFSRWGDNMVEISLRNFTGILYNLWSGKKSKAGFKFRTKCFNRMPIIVFTQ